MDSHARPELVIRMESSDEAWSFAVAFTAAQFRNFDRDSYFRCPAVSVSSSDMRAARAAIVACLTPSMTSGVRYLVS